MLDSPGKTERLPVALEAAVPFEVALTDQLFKHLCDPS